MKMSFSTVEVNKTSKENKETTVTVKIYTRKILIKNLIVISVSWLFLFVGFFAIANLQSSLNSNQSLGTLSLSANYVTLFASCLFFPKLMVKFFGLKWTIVISQAVYILFIASNMYPTWYTLFPGFWVS